MLQFAQNCAGIRDVILMMSFQTGSKHKHKHKQQSKTLHLDGFKTLKQCVHILINSLFETVKL